MTDTKFARQVLKRIAKYLPNKQKGRNSVSVKTVDVPLSLLEDTRTCIEDCLAGTILLESYARDLKRNVNRMECCRKLVAWIVTDSSYAEKCANILKKEGGAR